VRLQTFRSKEISKSNVVDDMVASNSILYEPGEHPDHCIVIKYIPYVGDSKRAMDEYTSEVRMPRGWKDWTCLLCVGCICGRLRCLVVKRIHMLMNECGRLFRVL
jgi:hypothetical protein